ncbi:MAG: AAA family ATPase [Paracoccaceae bacterium]
MRFVDSSRKEFIDHLKHFVHPSEEISIPAQLVGREDELGKLRDCFETNGAHAFVWGLRGVGKTSLVHTACAKYSDTVKLAAAVGCQKRSTYQELLKDIYRRATNSGIVNLNDSSIKGKLSLFGVMTLEGEKGGFREQLQIDSVNHASDFLNTILPKDLYTDQEWVIIVNEFDQLENQETINFFTSLAKQMSVDKVNVKFVFCGVASNLNDLIGSHESVDRYIKAVDLEPLNHTYTLRIAENIFQEFDVEPSRGQMFRISQIASGYPHFVHLIVGEILKECYETSFHMRSIGADIYKSSIKRAARGAATRLQKEYENATRKGTDRYIEVLWAAADGQLLVKQFKSIRSGWSSPTEVVLRYV